MNKEKKNLAIVIPDLHGGGAQLMMLNMAEEFAQRGYAVTVIVLCKVRPGMSSYSIDALGAHMNIISFKQKRVISALPLLIKYLMLKRPKVIIAAQTHVNIITLFAFFLSFSWTTKVIVSERAYHSINAVLAGTRYKMERFFMRLFYPYAHKVVGISMGVSKDIQTISHLSNDKVTTIYNPVITSGLKEKKNTVAAEHIWFDTSKLPAKRIVACGRFVPVKDYMTLLEAFKIIKKEKPDVILGFIGDGHLRPQFDAFIKESKLQNDVYFLGFQQNPLPYIKAADVFVSTSLSEGFGNVLVEAMYCGVPVVSTDCPSGPSEILQQGKYGNLVPVRSPKKLAHAIVQMIESPTERGMLYARANDFTVEKTCDDFEALFTNTKVMTS